MSILRYRQNGNEFKTIRMYKRDQDGSTFMITLEILTFINNQIIESHVYLLIYIYKYMKLFS